MKPLSVLLPCYNAEEHLPGCLESLARQSFPDFEIIAVDDGSTDGTSTLLDERARRDPRLRVIHAPHEGIAASLGRAASCARADLLARMDADDVAHPERFSAQVRYLEAHPGVDVLGTRVAMIPEGSLPRYGSWVNDLLTHEEIVRDLFVESPLPHPTVMMRRESFDRAGGYRVSSWPEDYDLWMRLRFSGARFAKLPEVLHLWRHTPGRASLVDPRYGLDRFYDLKEHYLVSHVLGEERAIAIWGAGPVGKTWARRLGRRGVAVVRFVEVDPRKIGQHIHGAEVIAAEKVAALRGTFILAAVGAPGGREEIRGRLSACGFVEGECFVAVA